MVVDIAATGSGVETTDLIESISTIAGALIALLVSWIETRRTSPERLQALISAYADWPKELDGRQRIVHAIGLEIAGLRPRMHVKTHREDQRDRILTDEQISKATRSVCVREWLEFAVAVVALVPLVWWMVVCSGDNGFAETAAGLVAGFAAFYVIAHFVRIWRRWSERAVLPPTNPPEAAPTDAPP